MRKAEPREKDLHHGQHHGQRRLEEWLGVMRLSIRYTIACLCFSLFCSFLASANVQGVAFFLQGRQKFELIRAELAVGKLQLFPVPPPQHTHTHPFCLSSFNSYTLSLSNSSHLSLSL